MIYNIILVFNLSFCLIQGKFSGGWGPGGGIGNVRYYATRRGQLGRGGGISTFYCLSETDEPKSY